MDKLLKSPLLSLKSRIFHPLFGAVLITWCILNWDFLFFIFSSDLPIDVRIVFAKEGFLYKYGCLYSLILPILIGGLYCLLYEFGTPYFRRVVERYSIKIEDYWHATIEAGKERRLNDRKVLLSAQINKLEKEEAKVYRNMESHERKIKDLEKKENSVEQHIQELTKEIKMINDEIATLRQAKSDVTLTTDILKREVKNLTSQKNSSEKQINFLLETEKGLVAKIESYKTEAAKVSKLKENIENEIRQLRSESNSIEESIVKLKHEENILLEENKQLKEEAIKLNAQKMKMEKDVEFLKNRLDSVEPEESGFIDKYKSRHFYWLRIDGGTAVSCLRKNHIEDSLEMLKRFMWHLNKINLGDEKLIQSFEEIKKEIEYLRHSDFSTRAESFGAISIKLNGLLVSLDKCVAKFAGPKFQDTPKQDLRGR